MSFLVCEADRQNLTREVIKGVALPKSAAFRTSAEQYSRIGNDDHNDGILVWTNASQHELREQPHFARVEDE